MIYDQSFYFSFLGNPLLSIRILFNLMNNALYQIHLKGQGKIYISCEEQDQFNILRFKDTAGGVTPALIERLFEDYVTTKAEEVRGLV